MSTTVKIELEMDYSENSSSIKKNHAYILQAQQEARQNAQLNDPDNQENQKEDKMAKIIEQAIES